MSSPAPESSTTAAPRAAPADTPAGRHPTAGDRDGDGGGRGTTRIEPRAVERVAAQAVHEVDNATGTARRVLGLSRGAADESSGAEVSARVDGPTATVEVTMTVIYPASVRAVTRRTRHNIINRVGELTGVSVRQVDITVAGMSVQRPDTPRVR